MSDIKVEIPPVAIELVAVNGAKLSVRLDKILAIRHEKKHSVLYVEGIQSPFYIKENKEEIKNIIAQQVFPVVKKITAA